MKIDAEKSTVYRFCNIADLSQAVLSLNETGYFSDDEDFFNYTSGTLTRVWCLREKSEFPFVFSNEETTDSRRYFIPENKVVFKEEKKKTLRPLNSIDEFFNVTGLKIGDVVQIKNFVGYKYSEKSILNGFRVYTDETYVIFGAGSRSFDELFKHYKYYKNGNWCRFSIEE